MHKKINSPSRSFEIGAFPRFAKRALTIPLAALMLHVLIMGGSGRGKSKLLQHILRALLKHGCGFTFHDPHGDGANELLEFMCVNPEGVVRQEVIDRTVYFEPGRLDNSVSFDLYDQYEGSSYDGREYESFLETTANHAQRIVQKLQGDDDVSGMARFGRWSRDYFIGAGIAFDDHGSHLGFDDGMALLNPQDDRHPAAFAKVAPRLKQLFPDVFYDFQKLNQTKRPIDQERWVESTINRLKPLVCTPSMRAMGGQHRPSLNIRELYRNGCPIVLNLSPTDCFSRDQGILVSGFIQFSEDRVARTTPVHERTERIAMIDEAEHFLDGSTKDTLGEGRKYKRSAVIAVQDGTCLRTEKHDHLSKLVSQAGMVVSFQQKAPDDLQYLSDFYAPSNFDFTPMEHVVDRPEQRWVFAPTLSFGSSEQIGRQIGRSRSVTNTISGQRTRTLSDTESTSVTRSRQTATGRNWSQGHGTAFAESNTTTWNDTATESEQRSISLGRSESESDTLSSGHSEGTSASDAIGYSRGDGRSTQLRSDASDILNTNTGRSNNYARGNSSSDSSSESKSRGKTESITDGRSFGTSQAASDGGSMGTTRTSNISQTTGGSETDTDGIANQTGCSRGKSDGRSIGVSHAEGNGVSAGASLIRGANESISYQLRQITQYQQEIQPTGKLLRSIPDQLAMFKHVLATLPIAHVLVRCNDSRTFLLRIATLADPYALAGPRLTLPQTATFKRLYLEQFKQRLFTQHPFYFNPLCVVDEPTGTGRFLGANVPSRLCRADEQNGNGRPKLSPNGNGHKPPPAKRIAGGLLNNPDDGDRTRYLEDADPENLIG